MRSAARLVYGTLGALALALGVVVLVRPALALPPEEFSPLTAHLLREQGAGGVFIGLMALWCVFNSEGRRPVHFALLLFAALFAAIHWFEYFEARRHLLSPVLNTLPFLALGLITPRWGGSCSGRVPSPSASS